MLAGFQRSARGAVAVLRRHAQRHRIELRDGGEHFLDGLKAGDAVDAGVAAGGGDELVVGVPGQRGQMLVADDLADADDADSYGCCLRTWGSGRMEEWGASS